MVSINVDKHPADINVIIFSPFLSSKDFTSSRDAVIHIIIETIATMVITSVDISDTPLICNLAHFIPFTCTSFKNKLHYTIVRIIKFPCPEV